MGKHSLMIFFGVTSAVLLLLVPFAGSPLVTDWVFRICNLVLLAVSWNLMAQAGLISLGHSGFWGLGAYAAILSANTMGASFTVSLVPTLLIGAVVGAGLALITGRLRGIYFAISTLAMSEAFRVLAIMIPSVTGGSEGVYLNTQLFPGVMVVNAATAGLTVLVVLAAVAVERSRLNYAFRAMRNNESAAQMLGINPTLYRVGVMALSGAMASLSGGLSLWYGGYLDPAVAFDLHNTILAQIAPILGGLYTLVGAVIGSVATIALSEITRFLFGDIEGISLLIFGVLLVVGILYMPNGIYGAIRRLWAWGKKKRGGATPPQRKEASA